MERVQIYLGEDELNLLKLEEARTGANRSELIRRAIRTRYAGRLTTEEKLAAIRASAGAWKDRGIKSGADYVNATRRSRIGRAAKRG